MKSSPAPSSGRHPEENDPLTVKCPNCQSNPGEKCTKPTVSGRQYINAMHLARTDLARGWL